MHILSEQNLSEFLATPRLSRFAHSDGGDGQEPALPSKANTLALKYIVQGTPMQLAFTLGSRRLYALTVRDDHQKPFTLWSLLEADEEKAALHALVGGVACSIFLFNELAVNVASTTCSLSIPSTLKELVIRADTGCADQSAFKPEATALLDRFHAGGATASGGIVAPMPGGLKWQPVVSHFITSLASASPVDLFHNSEGEQQEQLALWLTDGLHPLGVHHSPQIPKGKGAREFTDILLSYWNGSFLSESKTLAIFARAALPSRTKLARDIASDVTKAINQLRGGIRKLKDGVIGTSRSGVELEVNARSRSMG